jgi:4-amino-4-deoxy-L-arabinose transferase-like glycosyltransferase
MKKLLIVIFLIAAFLRFFQLGANPPSLTWDEVAWGYNAYSLGIDGRDEFGRFLPYDYLESFGDFKPPMYAYLSIIPVKFFGLNEFSTRFASAFFGTLTVLITYFLTKSIFDKRQTTQNRTLNHANTLALIAAGLLAISPWHIMLSRAAFEANIATFFIVFGVWMFLLAIYKKPFFLLLSVVSFTASIYTFNSARVVAPILLVILSVVFIKKLLSEKKALFLSILLGIIMILPIAGFLVSPQASLRYKEVNIFSDIDLVKTSNQEIANDGNAWWSRIIHNRRVIYTREFIKHYFDNLNPDFLFVKGDANPKFSTQDVGQMYAWELPFLVIGLLFLVRKRDKNWWIIPLWGLVGIIPAAFARETPHALRIEGSLPTFQILTAYGITQALFWLNNSKGIIKKLNKVFIGIGALLLFLNVLYFLHGYYVHYSREYSGAWQYGYKESINYIESVQDNYDAIYIGDSLGRPYAYTLFYTKYDPRVFRKEADVERDAFGFVHVKRFGKYKFPEVFKHEMTNSKILYVAGQNELPNNAKVLKEIKLLNGQPILYAYTL